MQSGWDGQGVCGAPADGQDQLLYSEVEGNLSLKAGEEEGRDRGLTGGGHCVSIAVNLPRCQMINSSW